MASLDDEIDGLYRLPLAEFTAARNALAKTAGARAAEIRGLQKPNAAAWVVNQVYWRHRKVFDALASASEKRRTTHVRRISGRDADVDTAEARYRAALDAAVGVARTLLGQAGESTSSGTMTAVVHTLEAVPAEGIQGRLTRPLEPVGFSMLAGLMASSRGVANPPADVIVMPRMGRTPSKAGDRARSVDDEGTARERAAEERRAAIQRRKERTRLERELKAAAAREKDAHARLAGVRHAIDQADARVEKLEQTLREARNAAHARREELDPARAAVNDAAADRVEIERALRALE